MLHIKILKKLLLMRELWKEFRGGSLLNRLFIPLLVVQNLWIGREFLGVAWFVEVVGVLPSQSERCISSSIVCWRLLKQTEMEQYCGWLCLGTKAYFVHFEAYANWMWKFSCKISTVKMIFFQSNLEMRMSATEYQTMAFGYL